MAEPSRFRLLPLLGELTCVFAAGVRAQPSGQQTYIVTLKDAAFPSRTTLLAQLRARVRAGDVIGFKAAVLTMRTKNDAAIAGIAASVTSSGGSLRHAYWALGGGAFDMSATTASAVAQRAEVAEVVEDVFLAASIANQTNASNHNADAVQALGLTGQGATLAVVDSGIDTDVSGTGQPCRGNPHPAFDSTTHGATRIVRAIGARDPLDFEDTSAVGHGTAVAGIAAARDWGSDPVTDHGFAPEANIASYKITIDANDRYLSSTWIEAWHLVLADRLAFGIVAAVASYSGNPSPTHVTQRILDIVGHYGDVLIATSSGNDGLLVDPTQQSQSNANGLAVGAIVGTTHDVWDRSTEGPLPGDPLRYWPDLCAVGVGVRAPRADQCAGTTLPLNGTSFAAPCVAGTAALLRGATAGASALDAKAWILNSCADVSSGANSELSRYFYGLGMLRTDVAVDTMQNGSIWHGTSRPTGTIKSVTVNLQPGALHAATLVWPRTEMRTMDWNDLDLRVVDPNGKVLAESASPRNLYERIRFTPQIAGDHRLEVVASEVVVEGIDWSLVLAPNPHAGQHPGNYVISGNGCNGTSGVDPAAEIIVPPSVTSSAFANARTTFPFADRPTRTMQAFDGSAIPTGTQIVAIGFRRDENDPGAPGFACTGSIAIGHTLRAPASLTTQFASNPDGPMQAVAGPTIEFAGTSGAPEGPGQFDYVIPLDPPFTAGTSATRHLLLDVQVSAHSKGSMPFGLSFDADLDFGAHARVWTQGLPFAPNGSIDALAPALSLITNTGRVIAPRLDFGGSLALGASFDVVLRNAPPNAIAALGHGLSNSSILGTSLPLDLGLIGAPGCELASSLEVILPANSNVGGQAAVEFAIANSPLLIGLEFYHQFLVLDPGANLLGVTVSNSGSGRVGG